MDGSIPSDSETETTSAEEVADGDELGVVDIAHIIRFGGCPAAIERKERNNSVFFLFFYTISMVRSQRKYKTFQAFGMEPARFEDGLSTQFLKLK